MADSEKARQEESRYQKIPVVTDFTEENGNDRMKERYRKTTIASKPA